MFLSANLIFFLILRVLLLEKNDYILPFCKMVMLLLDASMQSRHKSIYGY